MRRLPGSLIMLSTLVTPALSHAEELGFHNILTTSRSIISPSQYYQVREGGVAEANLGFTSGTVETQTAAQSKDDALKGSNYGLAAFLAINPSLNFGVNVQEEHLKVEDAGKGYSTVVSPSVTYSPIEALSIAAQANIARGHNKAEGTESVNENYTNFTFGMTAHRQEWEATAVVSTKNKDDKNALNNQPQTWGLHGRYHIMEPITLGVSYRQRDFSAFDDSVKGIKDETELGVHMESAMSETFSIEVDYFSTRALSGVKDTDATEFVLLGQALVTSTLEMGVRLSYRTIDGDATDVNSVNPSFFVATHF